MIGFKVFLTGLVVFVMLALIKTEIDPAVGTPAYDIIGLVGLFALVAVFSGTLIMVWSL